MLHFLCTACEKKGRQSMAVTPIAAFPASSHPNPICAFIHTCTICTKHTHKQWKLKQMHTLMWACNHAQLHMQEQRIYVNQINIYCSLCMVENLMNIRQAHQACAVNMNKDIIYTEDRYKMKRFNITLYSACKQWQMQILKGSRFCNTSIKRKHVCVLIQVNKHTHVD